MSRPYGGQHEARLAAAGLDDAHARAVAEDYVQELLDLGLEAPTLRKVRARLQERLDKGDVLPSLGPAALQQVIRLLTERLGG